MATRQEFEEYQRKLATYEKELVEYEAAKREWDALNATARARLDAQAEQGSRIMWGFLLILGLAWLAYVVLETKLQGDNLWFAWAGTCVALFVAWLLLQSVVGLLARAAVWAAGGACIGVLATIGFGAATGQELSKTAAFITAGVVGVLGLLAGLAPRHAGGPTKPTPPTKPP